MGKIADNYLLIDPWKIVEEGYHPDKSRVSESLFSLCNEHMGVRGYFDECYSGDSLAGSYVNGVYEEYSIKEPSAYKGISSQIGFMVNTVNWLHTCVMIDDEVLDLHRCRFSDFRRQLDFRTAELQREFIWHAQSGKDLKLTFSRLLSMQTNELGFQRIRVMPLNFSGTVSMTLGLDFSVTHECYRQNFWDCPQRLADEDTYAIAGVSKHVKQTLFAGFKVFADASADMHSVENDKLVGCRIVLDLIEGEEQTIDKLNVIYTNRKPGDALESTWSQGLELLHDLNDIQYEDVYQENATYWKSIWEKFDITIDGDPETQQGIRYCIFQLQQTYRGAVAGANIGAKGLTGEAYNGNAFWDTETYCLPYYLFNNPKAAKQLLDFRYKTLPQALQRANDLDCEGACFPIATINGAESCTLWQHASLQFQPTTAVAYAIWHYVNITRDTDFLYSEGIELLIQICRFLASRGQWSPRRGKFGYYAVMGPDEFQMMVNNNCYTNYMAQRTFQYTLNVLAGMQTACPGQKARILNALSCSQSECDAWRNMAEKMLIPYDEESGIYEQHEGFFDLPHINIHDIPVEEFPLYHHWSYDRIYRNDMIKQPDVLMFMLLYNQSFSLAEKKANYDYYEPRCIHESSLSPSVHSILASEIGLHDEAFEFFKFATRIDLDNYNRNTGEGIHMTSIAAAWMNIVYGFGGLRSDGDTLMLNPTIPKHWNAYAFRIRYRDTIIQVNVTQDQADIRVLEGPPCTIVIHGQARESTKDGFTLLTGEIL